MSMVYKVLEHVSEGVKLIQTEFGRQLWVKTNRNLRTPKNCHNCERPLIGMVAYRPVTNASNRMERLCLQCVGDSKYYDFEEAQR